MGVFSFLRRKRRNEPVVQHITEPVRPKKTASMVFVDMSNVYNRRIGSPRRIRWHELRMRIRELVEGTELLHSHAYFEAHTHSPLYLEQVRPGFEGAGYTFEKYHKSIDILLGSDMWSVMVRAVAARKYDVIRIVLVSGDDDFARPLGDIAKMFRSSTLAIEIVIVSWTDSMGYVLSNLAHTLVRIEEIPNILKDPRKNAVASS